MKESGIVTTVSESGTLGSQRSENQSIGLRRLVPLALVDLISLVGVCFLARFVSGHLSRIEGFGTEISAGHFGFSTFFIALTTAAVWFGRTRDYSPGVSTGNVVRLLGAISFAAMLTALAAYLGLFGAVEGFDPRATVVVWALSILIVPAGELLVRGGYHLLKRKARHEIPVIVIGEPGVVPAAVSQFRDNGHSYRMIGLVCPSGVNANGGDVSGIPTLGNLESLPQIVRTHTNGHSLVVALPNSSYSHLKPLVEAQRAVQLAMFPMNGASGSVARRASFPWIYEKVKRGMDIAIALGALLVASPIILTLAALIKLESRGPVFYAQTRVGRNGHFFKMHKFRSMRKDADKLLEQLKVQNEAKGPMFKIARDPRITRVGAVIRRLSLDELPQLFDVVAGTMSIIGPRPPLPHEVEQYEPRHFRRFEAIPGITGLWQVKRGSEIDFDEMVDLDIEYIDSWSLRMDISILLKTLPAMLKGQGAM